MFKVFGDFVKEGNILEVVRDTVSYCKDWLRGHATGVTCTWILPAYKYKIRWLRGYCHICIDGCPNQHKSNRNPDCIQTYKTVMKKTQAWFIKEEDKVLGNN